MLKSNNFKSVTDDFSEFSSKSNTTPLRPTSLPLDTTTSNIPTPQSSFDELLNANISNKYNTNNATTDTTDEASLMETTSLAAQQLTDGFMQSYAPSIAKAKGQLKELIQKQNKIYIDLSAEKYKLDNAEVAKLHEMMNNVKLYREKLLKIKKQMQNIYQRTKVLKKKAINIQTCKEKEIQRKLQKLQQEESLIGKHPQ